MSPRKDTKPSFPIPPRKAGEICVEEDEWERIKIKTPFTAFVHEGDQGCGTDYHKDFNYNYDFGGFTGERLMFAHDLRNYTDDPQYVEN